MIQKPANKLSLAQRRAARDLLERGLDETQPPHALICHDSARGDRPAYDLDLFDGPVTREGRPINQPPRPHAATPQTFELHRLFDAWRKCTSWEPDDKISSLARIAGNGVEQALVALDTAFHKIERAQIALLRVDPGNLQDWKRDILALFERIGAGGTPLTAEKRLFSIYKHHVPAARNAVDLIYKDAGRVMQPTKIVGTALRIANASKELKLSYYIPDVKDFADEMATSPPSELRRKLETLIPVGRDRHPLRSSFKKVKDLLSYSNDAGAFWMPDVLLVQLPAGVWQVLTFWAMRRTRNWEEPIDLEESRQEAVRFALFWHLCVWNDEKAAAWCFEYVKANQNQLPFPGASLYRILSGHDSGEQCAHRLVSADEFDKWRLSLPADPKWRTDGERFGEGGSRNDAVAHWWWYGRKVLPWLQRDYVRRAFPGYAPLTDHEDDLPYDVDHLCPYKDWGDDWRTIKDRLDLEEPLKKSMRDGRVAVGNGIGNLRLVDSSINRRDQDDGVAQKVPFILRDEPPGVSDSEAMANWAFAPEHRQLWRQVSRPDRRWDTNRLSAFQKAVEWRAAWLYRRFHDDLGYAV